MARRKVPIVVGNYYHLYNRGNQRENIFFEPKNYFYFLKRLREYLESCSTIVCYCLMPNHFHFIMQPTEEVFVRKMQNFFISYAKSINKAYNRTGHLFQGNYEAKHIGDHNIILHVSRYIHSNPVEANMVKRAEDWEFSSYREYIGERSGTLPKYDIVLKSFEGSDNYRQFVESFQDRKIIENYIFEE